TLWGRALSSIPFLKAKRDLHTYSLIAVCLCLALARPQWGEIEENHQTTGLDIVVAVDVSNSMEAEDVVPTRLKKVKFVLKQMVARLAGDRVGIIAFAGSAHLQSPLTNDYDYLREVIDGLSPASVSNQGTDLGAALKTSVDTLNRGAEQIGSAERPNSASSRVILLVSDGEDHEEHIQTTIDLLKQNAVSFFAFGVGTETGVPIPVRDPNGIRVGYKRDQKGETVMSRFHPEVLKEISDPLNGQYWTLGAGEREMESFLAALDSLSRGSKQDQKVVTREERFQWPLGLGILILLISLPGRRQKSRLAASPVIASAVVLFLAYASEACADTTLGGYLGNQEALKQLEKKDFSQAKDGVGAITQYLKAIDDAKQSGDTELLEKSQQALLKAAQQQSQPQ
ncbi:MAG: VWA domain-containing protein, partial [Proteobacteria bacterium]